MRRKDILLVCSIGMSTSMLVFKMKQAAQKRNLDINILALGEADGLKKIRIVDVVLLGPQVMYLFDQYEKIASEKNIPVSIIDELDYGELDGERVLDEALRLMEESRR